MDHDDVRLVEADESRHQTSRRTSFSLRRWAIRQVGLSEVLDDSEPKAEPDGGTSSAV